jgi:hypothetical protein
VSAEAWTERLDRARAALTRLPIEPEEEAWLATRTAVDRRLLEIEAAIGTLIADGGGADGDAAQLGALTALLSDNDRLRDSLARWASAWPDDQRWREARAAVSRRLSEVEELGRIGDGRLRLALGRERQALPRARRARAGELVNQLTGDQSEPQTDSEPRSETELLLREAVRAGNDQLRARLLSMRSPDPPHWREIRSATSERLFEIEALMPLLSGDGELRLQLVTERHREPSSLPKALEERADTLLTQLSAPTERTAEQRSEAELLVAAAVGARNDQLREQQAATAARINYMTWMTFFLALTGALTAVMIILTEGDAKPAGLETVLLVMAAGALGGTLSGLLTIRAPWRNLRAIERLGPGAIIQPILGIAGGLALYFIWSAKAFNIANLDRSDWAAIAAVAFAGGFSEALVLKSINRLTGDRDSAPAGTTTQRTDPSA